MSRLLLALLVALRRRQVRSALRRHDGSAAAEERLRTSYDRLVDLEAAAR
jgi:hypothetical protein